MTVVVWRAAPPGFDRCLASLAGQTVPVTLAALASECSPGEVERLHRMLERHPGLSPRLHLTDRNVGFAGGHNFLLARVFAAGLDLACVLNPDTELAPDCLERLAAAARTVGGPALIGPLLERADEVSGAGEGVIDTAGIRWTRTGRHFDALQGRPLAAAPRVLTRVSGVSGACCLVTRATHDALLARCGEFFDADFIAYREDAELGVRAGLLGIPSYVEPSATGRHVRAQRGATRGRSRHIDRLGVRNRLLLRYKLGPARPGAPVLRSARDALVVAAAWTVERHSWAGVVDARRHRRRMLGKRRQFLATDR